MAVIGQEPWPNAAVLVPTYRLLQPPVGQRQLQAIIPVARLVGFPGPAGRHCRRLRLALYPVATLPPNHSCFSSAAGPAGSALGGVWNAWTGWGLCSEVLQRIFGAKADDGHCVVGRRSNEVWAEECPALQPVHCTSSLAWHTFALFPPPPPLSPLTAPACLSSSTPRPPPAASPRNAGAGGRRVSTWEQAYAADWDIRRHVVRRRASLQLPPNGSTTNDSSMPLSHSPLLRRCGLPGSIGVELSTPGSPLCNTTLIRPTLASTTLASDSAKLLLGMARTCHTPGRESKVPATPRPASARLAGSGKRRSSEEVLVGSPHRAGMGREAYRESGASINKTGQDGAKLNIPAHLARRGERCQINSTGAREEVPEEGRCGALDLCRWGRQLQQAVLSRDAAALDAGIYGSISRTQASVAVSAPQQSGAALREERRWENRRTGLQAGDTAVPLTGLRRVVAPPGRGCGPSCGGTLEMRRRVGRGQELIASRAVKWNEGVCSCYRAILV